METLFLVGLGNPGLKYRFTRHNLGFMFVDNVAEKYKKSKRCPVLYSKGSGFMVLKPVTFMNRSGIAVKCMVEKNNISLNRLLVVCDDFNLPLGKIRLRPDGSSGLHNGLQSIVDELGTKEFPRLRIGIGGADILDKKQYVLDKFKRTEMRTLKDVLSEAPVLVNYYLKNGVESTMNRYN
ncbi:aminoacyl-tRNA hydrolase [Elusimicrobiota bacterium]